MRIASGMADHAISSVVLWTTLLVLSFSLLRRYWTTKRTIAPITRMKNTIETIIAASHAESMSPAMVDDAWGSQKEWMSIWGAFMTGLSRLDVARKPECSTQSGDHAAITRAARGRARGG